MGHSESFYFVDPRDGEYGVEYHRPSRHEAEQLAVVVGVGRGGVQVRIKAYPPKPTAAVHARRIGCYEDPIPF